MPRIAIAFGIVLGFASAAFGQAPVHDVTVNDYFSLPIVMQAALSPDGKHVAYTEARWDKASNDRKTDLWVIDVESGTAGRLTAERAGNREVRWGADNRSLYYLGNRRHEGDKKPPYDGSTQVWKVSRAGGQPSAVTRVEGGVDAFDLTADGRTLFYTVQANTTDRDAFTSLREKYTGLEYGHGSRRVSQLWKLDLRTERADKVLDARRYIREFTVTRDGKRIALITTPDDKVITFEGRSRIDILDTDSGEARTLPDRLWRADAPSPYAWLEALAWSPDGKRLAFNAIFDAYPTEIIVTEWREGEPKSVRLDRGGRSVRGYGTPLQWRTPTRLCWLAEEKARVWLAENVFGDGEPAQWKRKDAVVSAFSCDASGERRVALMGDATHFPELFLIEGDGEPRRLTDFKSQTAGWKLPRVSVVSWKGANGDTVGGVLELPADHRPGQKLPLIVGIHGGPTSAVHANLTYEIWEGRTYLPAHGYALLLPNYRGSTGYGDKFLTDLVGKENDLDVQDILKGVDALIERGIADPERLGVMGWSNGGYLTNCVITHTTRFKAASSGAGILDTVIEWGTNDEPAYPTVLKQGFPWQRPDNYRKTSPSYDLGKVRTPTLIHVGGSDERCPPGHSRMLYRALKEYVKVPAELIVYPGEPHGLTKYAHRKAKMEWDLAWFDRYVRGRRSEEGR
jgi:dipeptidyl aminopeptidase/acylaminoacyl peptidase